MAKAFEHLMKGWLNEALDKDLPQRGNTASDQTDPLYKH